MRTQGPTMRRLGGVVAAVLAAATFGLGGCSGLVNKGGDTTCEEFKTQDADKQKSEVSAMLKKRKGQQPSNGEITATRLAAEAFCKTIGKDSSKIKEIDPT